MDLFKYLRDKAQSGGPINWNFGKFIVNGEGKVQRYYTSNWWPQEIAPDIEKMLGIEEKDSKLHLFEIDPESEANAIS